MGLNLRGRWARVRSRAFVIIGFLGVMVDVRGTLAVTYTLETQFMRPLSLSN